MIVFRIISSSILGAKKECPLGTFGYQDFRPLTFVVMNCGIESIMKLISKPSLIPIGIGLGHYPEPCQSPFRINLKYFLELTYGFLKSSIDRPSSFPLLMQGKNLSSSISTIRNPKYFFGQATPRFELGIKDLQSPALPLGHAAKSDPKSSKILFIHIILLISIRRRGLLNPFLFFLDRRIPFQSLLINSFLFFIGPSFILFD